MMKSLRCLLLLASAAAANAQPLAPGEQLVYSVSWAVIPGAGRITVEAKKEKDRDGAPTLQVETKTETRGLAHLFLPFEAWANSVYDAGTGRLKRFEETSKVRGKSSAHTINFDYRRHEALYRDLTDDGPVDAISMPDGNPADLINCLLQARSWHLKPGESRDALVFFEKDMYLLTIHAIDYEDIDTAMGEAHALLLEPRMEKTPPKGMFKRGETVRVWVGQQDGHELPLRFVVQFKVGAGTASLIAYRPGAATALAAAVRAPADRN